MSRRQTENVYGVFTSKIGTLAVTNRAGERYVFFFDSDDLPRIKAHWWNIAKRSHGRIYLAAGNWDEGAIYLHRFLMGVTGGMQVDHSSRNTLDNRKQNLRIATAGNNQSNQGISASNRTGAVGVHLDKRTGRFVAQVRDGNKTKYLGRFETADEAIAVRDEAAVKHYGEFAFTNKEKDEGTTICFM